MAPPGLRRPAEEGTRNSTGLQKEEMPLLTFSFLCALLIVL
jgi:hypothetical protein